MKHDNDPFSIPGDTRPMCGVCFTRLSSGAHYATVQTSNLGTQIVCAQCISQFAEKRISELEADNARLRGLLRPICQDFFEWSVAHPNMMTPRNDVAGWCGQTDIRHMRACCDALGIEVEK